MMGQDNKTKWNTRARVAVIGVVAPLCLALGLSACGRFSDENALTFDGFYFRTDVDLFERKVRDHFRVEVRNPQQSLAGAREAGRHEAISHCIEQYGTSVIEWVDGPDVEDAELIFDKDTLVFEGYCRP
ncbi:hypothetical protein NBRC116590_04760 [Pelagimonas sp. KU-00592-HH]|uniref:hypothetical protein n=1 Tax=Pelagimonas sp. KU-00592-HH TaxID=3127651 RepID=UPI0031064E21